VALLAQPANDDCANAQPIPVGTPGNCTIINTTNVGATDDGPQTCDATTNNWGTWYSFTAPASGALFIQVIDLGTGDPEAAIYDACGGTSVWCDGTPDAEVVPGLTPGATYFLLVWGDAASFVGAFNLCLEEFVPPANDDCADAIPVAVGAVGSCPANAINGSNLGAIDDGGFSCDASVNFGVWYSFVAPASGSINIQVGDLGPGNPEAAILDGCGGTEVWCSTAPDDVIVPGLTPGATYLLNVWGDASQTAPFSLCISEFVPYVNDVCSGAIPITVGSFGSCPANAVAGSTTGAMDDGLLSCDATTNNMGVWYTFTAPPSGAINILVTDLGPGNPEAAIFDGCGGTEIWCDISPDDETVSGLTPGADYYVLVWSDLGTTTQGPFTICAQELMPPVNSDCSGAIDLGAETSPISSNTGNALNNEDISCLVASRDLFYYIDVPPGITLEIGQTTNDYDSRNRVAYGGACPGDNEIACFDDPDDLVVSWTNTTSMTQRVYWTQEGFTTTSAGNFTLAWELIQPPAPANDDCMDAISIECGETVSGTTLGSTYDGFEECGPDITAPGVWYTFTAGDEARFYRLSTCDAANFDTEISVFNGSCERLVCIGSNLDVDDCGGGTTDLIFTPAFGQVHYILVHGAGLSQGDFELTLECDVEAIPTGCTDPNALNYDPDALLDDGSCIYPPPAPPGDACSSAFSIGCGQTVAGTTVGFTDSNPSACGGAGDGASPGVWYTLVGTGDQVTAETCGSGFDTQVAIYTGSCAGLACVAGNDDACGLQSSVSWLSSPGAVYYIYVDGFAANSGDYTLAITCSPPPPPLPGDVCSAATPIALAAPGGCGSASVMGSTIGAGDDGPQTCDATTNNLGVWYSFTAPASGIVILRITELSGQHEAAIYTACGGASIFCDITPNTETVSGLTPGATYFLLVWSDTGVQGNHTVCVEEVIAPDNDDCADAIELACNTRVSGSTQFAGLDAAPVCSDQTITARGVWYTFVATTRIVNLNTCGSNFDTKLSVYTGSCGALVCVAGNDDFCNTQSSITLLPVSGQRYYVLVHGFGTAAGTFTLEYDCENALPRPPQGPTPVVNTTSISLFPNPAQDELNVKLEGFMGDRATLLVHNSLGQLMMERRVAQVEEPVIRLNTSQLQSGMYFLTVNVDGKGKFTEKFMVGTVRP